MWFKRKPEVDCGGRRLGNRWGTIKRFYVGRNHWRDRQSRLFEGFAAFTIRRCEGSVLRSEEGCPTLGIICLHSGPRFKADNIATVKFVDESGNRLAKDAPVDCYGVKELSDSRGQGKPVRDIEQGQLTSLPTQFRKR